MAQRIEQPPRLRGIRPEKIIEFRRLSDGKWLFKVSNRKGEGDFKVTMFDPEEGRRGRRLTPTYGHFAIDIYGKLCRNRKATGTLLSAVERVFDGFSVRRALAALRKAGDAARIDSLPGYSTEYTLRALEFIFAQEETNWERDMAGKPLPSIRKSLIRRNILSPAEANKGSGLAIALLRQIVRYNIHPVTAMKEALLRI